jgi:hypothetical protein
MKLNYGTIEVIYTALKNLEEQELPIAAATIIIRNIDLLEKEVKILNIAKNKLIRKYGKPTKMNTIQILPTDETWDDYVKEILPILQMEIEINYTDPQIPIKDLGDKVRITPSNLRSLQGLKIISGLIIESQKDTEIKEIPVDETPIVPVVESNAE